MIEVKIYYGDTKMKKILSILVLFLLIVNVSGCQYFPAPLIKAGSTEIIKDSEKTIPEKTTTPNRFEVEIIPPKPVSSPGFSNDSGRWYIPERENERR